MADIPISTLVNAIAELLTEAYAGPPDPRSTWFIDNEPDSGILGMLAGVSATEASTPVNGVSEPGSTIAANAEHLRWSLANANNALRGQEYQGNWKESWHLQGADEQAWDELRAQLQQEFETLRAAIQQQNELPGPYLLGVLGLIPHAAFHLGIIRQMIERVQHK